MKKIIEVKNLFKVYDELLENPVIALNNINFSMNEGEFICVMGPSGAGKSTFLNCISSIDLPTKGKVIIDGITLNELSTKKIGEFRYKNLGFVFQDSNLLNYLTLYENISIPLSLFNEKKDYIYKKVIQVARYIGIEDLLKKYPFECSGGQLQRAGICRAVINQPKLLIADEPTGNLDSKNSHEVMKMFRMLNQKGVSILMVTHDPMVASYSDRVIYIKDSEIKNGVERGTKEQNEYFYEIVKMNSNESLDILDYKN